jgi:hypothetical protein
MEQKTVPHHRDTAEWGSSIRFGELIAAWLEEKGMERIDGWWWWWWWFF